MNRFQVNITMTVDLDVEQVQGLGHELIRKLVAEEGLSSELGPDATAQQVADFYTHNPGTVVSAIVRAMLAAGLQPVDHLLTIGQNRIESKQIT